MQNVTYLYKKIDNDRNPKLDKCIIEQNPIKTQAQALSNMKSDKDKVSDMDCVDIIIKDGKTDKPTKPTDTKEIDNNQNLMMIIWIIMMEKAM